MPHPSLHRPRPAHTRAGAVSRQMLMTIGLVLVIAASLAYTWSQLMGGAPTPPRVVEMAFKCSVCGHEQTTTNEAFQQRPIHNDILAKDKTRTMDNMDCPKCGEKHASMLMRKCLSCEKFFLPHAVNIRTLPAGAVPPDPVCPHCGTNQNQWRREHLN